MQRRGGGTIHCCDASSASDGIHARTPRIQQDEPPQLAIKSAPLIALSSMHTANPSSGWPGIGFVSSRPRTLSASSRRAAPSQSDQPSRTKMKIDGAQQELTDFSPETAVRHMVTTKFLTRRQIRDLPATILFFRPATTCDNFVTGHFVAGWISATWHVLSVSKGGWAT